MNGREYLEDFVDRTMVLQDFPGKIDVDLKISALILTLEKLQRIRRSKLEPMEYETFEQCILFLDAHKVLSGGPRELDRSGGF